MSEGAGIKRARTRARESVKERERERQKEAAGMISTTKGSLTDFPVYFWFRLQTEIPEKLRF